VPGVEIDLILCAVQSEADGTLGGAAVEVIDEQGLYLMGHGRPGPLTGLQRISVCSLPGKSTAPGGFRPGPSWWGRAYSSAGNTHGPGHVIGRAQAWLITST
jgi:hypothetical protein